MTNLQNIWTLVFANQATTHDTLLEVFARVIVCSTNRIFFFFSDEQCSKILASETVRQGLPHVIAGTSVRSCIIISFRPEKC